MKKVVPTARPSPTGRVLPDLSQQADLVERVQVFDPEAIRRALQEFDDADDWSEWSPEKNAHRAVEDVEWRRVLKTLADDPERGLRDAFICDDDVCARVRGLKTTIPHMRTAIEIVERAALASSSTNTRFRLPPLCLVGPPGTSKSFFARRCLEALGVHHVKIDLSMTNERGKLSGYSRSWRGARIGALASAVVDRRNKTSCAGVFLDEIDKFDPRERVADVLLSALEPENAQRFVDEYITDIAPIRLDHAAFILAANDAALIPRPVLDRMIVIEVERPCGDALETVTHSIYREAVADLAAHIEPELDRQSMTVLSELAPRKIRQVLELAIPMAIAAGKRVIEPADIQRAAKLVDHSTTLSVGFVQSRARHYTFGLTE